MRPETREYWREPGYWRWWLRTRVTTEAKVVLGLLLAMAIVASGFVSAGKLGGSQATSRVFTVVRTTSVAGKPPHVVTEVRTISEEAKTTVVTRRHDGQTVVLRAAPETVTRLRTVRGPAGERVVTQKLDHTVTQTRDRLRTVTAPGSTVQGPERVVTAPGTTVTTPGRTETETITQTLPAKTVTNEVTVTQPPVTVTQTTEVTVTETVKK